MGVRAAGNARGETSTDTFVANGSSLASAIGLTLGVGFRLSEPGEELTLFCLELFGVVELLLLLALTAFSRSNRSSHNPAEISLKSRSNSAYLLSSSRIC